MKRGDNPNIQNKNGVDEVDIKIEGDNQEGYVWIKIYCSLKLFI